jgi:hypothetical protein
LKTTLHSGNLPYHHGSTEYFGSSFSRLTAAFCNFQSTAFSMPHPAALTSRTPKEIPPYFSHIIKQIAGISGYGRHDEHA